jgi:hypothetical protein
MKKEKVKDRMKLRSETKRLLKLLKENRKIVKNITWVCDRI